jgi:hypothetical protein
LANIGLVERRRRNPSVKAAQPFVDALDPTIQDVSPVSDVLLEAAVSEVASFRFFQVPLSHGHVAQYLLVSPPPDKCELTMLQELVQYLVKSSIVAPKTPASHGLAAFE